MIKPSALVPVLLAYKPDPPMTAIPPSLWPEVQARYAAGESFRTLAKDYGVSYEAVRGITQRPI